MTQREPDRDEPLLRAVVKVALDPPTLLVGGRDDAGPRGFYFCELTPQPDAQAGDLNREPSRFDDPSQEGGILVGRSVMKHQCERLPAALHRNPLPPVLRKPG